MKQSGEKLVKIGQLAKKFQVLPSTINYYTNEGILPAATRSPGGYRLYRENVALKRLSAIVKLQQDRRLTIEEIKKIFK